MNKVVLLEWYFWDRVDLSAARGYSHSRWYFINKTQSGSEYIPVNSGKEYRIRKFSNLCFVLKKLTSLNNLFSWIMIFVIELSLKKMAHWKNSSIWIVVSKALTSQAAFSAWQKCPALGSHISTWHTKALKTVRCMKPHNLLKEFKWG